MTDEAHGLTADEAPVPPASTRWSEDAVADDETPPPPFVPGREEAFTAAMPGEEPDAGEVPSEGGTAPAESEPFPFEMPLEEEADEEEALAPADSAEDDFPIDRFDIEGRGEEAGPPPQAEAAATAEPELAGGGSPANVLEQEREDVAAPEPEAELRTPSPHAPAAEPAVTEVVALLEYLADMLRSEGEAAVRRELDSPDRLTAVLAGLLAGYLSGRS